MLSASSSNEMLHIKGSATCSHPACHLVDFLPIKCHYCRELFCNSHFLPFEGSSSGHACSSPPTDRKPIPCPVCTLPVGFPPGTDPNDAMDTHLRSLACAEKQLEVGREKERLKERKIAGQVCYARGCKKTLLGGLGVKCSKCAHLYCTNHRFDTSHVCTPPASSSASTTSRTTVLPASSNKPASTPTPALIPSGIRAALGGPRRDAALAAIKRQQPPKPATPASASSARAAVIPLKPSEKDPNPHESKIKIKPLVNPLSATSRHTKQEAVSRRKALAFRASKGLLTEEEKIFWASEVGREEEGRRKKERRDDKNCVIA